MVLTSQALHWFWGSIWFLHFRVLSPYHFLQSLQSHLWLLLSLPLWVYLWLDSLLHIGYQFCKGVVRNFILFGCVLTSVATESQLELEPDLSTVVLKNLQTRSYSLEAFSGANLRKLELKKHKLDLTRVQFLSIITWICWLKHGDFEYFANSLLKGLTWFLTRTQTSLTRTWNFSKGQNSYLLELELP